jgi:hypothetical protein
MVGRIRRCHRNSDSPTCRTGSLKDGRSPFAKQTRSVLERFREMPPPVIDVRAWGAQFLPKPNSCHVFDFPGSVGWPRRPGAHGRWPFARSPARGVVAAGSPCGPARGGGPGGRQLGRSAPRAAGRGVARPPQTAFPLTPVHRSRCCLHVLSHFPTATLATLARLVPLRPLSANRRRRALARP